MTNTIEFTCWEKDKPLEIQLEPEAFLYKINPNNNIKFVATGVTEKFHWTLRIDDTEKIVQLFPGDFDSYIKIEIYINGERISNIAYD